MYQSFRKTSEQIQTEQVVMPASKGKGAPQAYTSTQLRGQGDIYHGRSETAGTGFTALSAGDGIVAMLCVDELGETNGTFNTLRCLGCWKGLSSKLLRYSCKCILGNRPSMWGGELQMNKHNVKKET